MPGGPLSAEPQTGFVLSRRFRSCWPGWFMIFPITVQKQATLERQKRMLFSYMMIFLHHVLFTSTVLRGNHDKTVHPSKQQVLLLLPWKMYTEVLTNIACSVWNPSSFTSKREGDRRRKDWATTLLPTGLSKKNSRQTFSSIDTYRILLFFFLVFRLFLIM